MEAIKDIVPIPLNGRVLIELIKQEPQSQIYGVDTPQPNLGKVVKAYYTDSAETVAGFKVPTLVEGAIVQFNTGVPPVKLANSDTIVSIRYSEIYHVYPIS